VTRAGSKIEGATLYETTAMRKIQIWPLFIPIIGYPFIFFFGYLWGFFEGKPDITLFFITAYVAFAFAIIASIFSFLVESFRQHTLEFKTIPVSLFFAAIIHYVILTILSILIFTFK